MQKRKLIPRSLSVKALVPTAAGRKTATKASEGFVKNRVTDCHFKINALKSNVRKNTEQLFSRLDRTLFVRVLQKITEKVRRTAFHIKIRHERKLTVLRSTKKDYGRKITSNTTPGNIMNLSSHELTPKQKELLGFGLNFNIANKRLNIPRTLAALEPAICKVESTRQPEVRASIARTIVKHRTGQNKHIDKDYIDAMNDLRKNEQITVTRSDKGAVTVIMDRAEYIQKAMDHLNDGEIYERIRTDPTLRAQKEVNKTITTLVKDNKLTTDKGKQLKSINACIPKFYGLPKVHKPNRPLRPVLDSRGAPTFKLSKFLTNYLKPIVIKANYTVKDSQALLNEIRHLKPNANELMVSFDIIALYTSIPKDLVDEVLGTVLEPSTLDELNMNAGVNLAKDDVINLVQTCIGATYFSFGDLFFKQKEGVAMGSPISSVIADITMTYIENKIMQVAQDKILYWRRYVDDVLSIVVTSEIDSILTLANSINSKIQFTCEREVDGKIPFLDILITRRLTGLTTTVYRKPVASNFYLNFNSMCPITHKLAVINTLVHRMLRYCTTSKAKYLEKNKIVKDLKMNGYPEKLVRKRISMIENKFVNRIPVNKCNDNVKYVTIPYVPVLSEKIADIFKKEKLQIAYKTNNKLGQILKPKEVVKPEKRREIVYAVPCKSCKQTYVGQSGRDFKTRQKEHMANLKYANSSSKMVEHMYNENHEPDWENSAIITSGIRPLSARLFYESFASKYLFPSHYNESAPFPAQYEVALNDVTKSKSYIKPAQL